VGTVFLETGAAGEFVSEYDVVFAIGAGAPGSGRSEESHDRAVHGCGNMHGTCVGGNEQPALGIEIG